ncbi:MAG: hypothetical protein JWN09_2920 [Microbacteriaceae bacterium]|nr:hypothetical protein [Microbacteriaceae bacterium]
MSGSARSHPARSAARRAAVTTAVGGTAAVGFGALAAALPLALPAVIVVPVVVLVPIVAVAFAVLADGVVFPLLLTGTGATILNMGVLGAALLALPAALIRRAVNPVVLRIVVVLALMIVPGIVIALFVFPSSQVLSGIRYFVVPVAVAVLASSLSDRQLRLLLKAVTMLIAASFIAAIIETMLGSDALLKLTGLAYGVSIRNFGAALRAPGTFATNFHLGAYSSVVAVVALLWWGTLRGSNRDVAWRIVALVSSIGCLALSTYRTGVVLLVVSVIAAVFLSGSAVRLWLKLAVAIVGIGVATGFLLIGLGNTDSYFQRLDVWNGLLSGSPSLLGRGIGYAGAASGAAGSAIQIFTDNYYISLWLQFGIPGLVIVGIFVGIFVALFRAGRLGNSRAAVAVSLWTGVLVAFAFVELWEYTSAMCLIALVVGSSAAGYRRSSPAPGVDLTEHTMHPLLAARGRSA